MKKLPVDIITGYLGSGKTTLLNHLLKLDHKNGKLALIVNDIGSVNIDASLIKDNKNVKKEDMKMVEMSNGCICCTLQTEFMSQIEELSKDPNIDKIMVEASGVSNPANICNGFLQYKDYKPDSRSYLNSVISVVDVKRIYDEYFNDINKYLESDEEEDPDIINLIIDQIEFCNTIIVNKCDLLKEEDIQKVIGLIKRLQPEARLIRSVNSEVSPEELFVENRFDFDNVMNSSAISKALDREEKMEKSGIDDFGITSFVFESRRPLDEEKFMDFVDKNFPDEIIRSKGYVWFDNDRDNVKLFESAGKSCTITKTGKWLAAFTKKEQEDIFKEYPDILADWDEKYGDRLNQIVFIGRNYDKKKINEILTSCLKD